MIRQKLLKILQQKEIVMSDMEKNKKEQKCFCRIIYVKYLTQSQCIHSRASDIESSDVNVIWRRMCVIAGHVNHFTSSCVPFPPLIKDIL